MIGVSGAGAALGAVVRPELVIIVPLGGRGSLAIVCLGSGGLLGAPGRPQVVIMVGAAVLGRCRLRRAGPRGVPTVDHLGPAGG